jgi:hypothetical protein
MLNVVVVAIILKIKLNYTNVYTIQARKVQGE